jgi:Ca2+-transporting ATPase
MIMAGRWHALTPQETVELLRSDCKKGLPEKEVKERLAQYGSNELAKAPKAPLWQLFLNQFKDFMVLVLLVATAVSGLLGEYADAVAILIIVVVNAILGFIQEYRAERSMEALKQLTAPEARVIRGGQERKISAAGLVPGDLVLLEEGDRIPADLRLLHAINLEVEESSLTGESVPVKKQENTLPGEQIALGDTRNMAYLGTSVTRGRGRGIVVHTGMATEMGHIAGMIQAAGQEETPLQRRLAQLGKGLVAFCLIVCAAVVVLGILRGEEAYQMFLAGVSLAVAAIPEGLPAIVTVALAIGVQRMIRRHAIIRKLPAVETLGCATVICSDKTGTLTQNQMTVRRVVVGEQAFDVTGEGYDPKGEFEGAGDPQGPALIQLMKAAALCNNAVLERGGISVAGLFRGLVKGRPAPGWSVLGDPTEGALLVMAAKAGLWRERIEAREPRVAELPFDADRKRMTVLCRQPGGSITAYVKGAPDVILELCTHIYKDGLAVPLSARDREDILSRNALMAEKALRVLAFACRDLPSGSEQFSEEAIEQKLVFLGLAGMIDPPRPAALKAVQTCHKAGIKAVMITGDHPLTARAVARELGILAKDGEILTGRDLDRLSESRLQELAKRVSVYARVSPKHKLQIVRALKRSGHVVAMTGDGVNDAPAVKEADIGIAMGATGTDVTKEASAMVLTDDNFSNIVAAVEEGRGIYDNIRKFIRYLLSCNVGEVLTMFLAVLAGMPLPLIPIQILWMNLVTDGLPAMALGVDPYDRDIMTRPPRHPRESVFAHGMTWRIGINGTFIGLGTLLSFWIGLSMGDLDLARTIAFNTLVFFQLFFVFTCRSEFHTILELGLLTNPYLVGAVLISASLQLLVDYTPLLQPIFHTVPLSGQHWALILGIASAPTVVGTLSRYFADRARQKIMYLRV